MVSLFLQTERPGVIVEDCLTAEAAARLTGYNIQHIRRLALAGLPYIDPSAGQALQTLIDEGRFPPPRRLRARMKLSPPDRRCCAAWTCTSRAGGPRWSSPTAFRRWAL